jgi:glycosyltransferase involved in cell wall biosynthesis
MRVTHVITRLIVGGAQENTIASVLGLRARPELQVDLLAGPTTGAEGSLQAVVEQAGCLTLVPELIRAVRPWTDWLAYRRLANHFRATRPDIVHTHSGKAGILGRLAAHQAGVPIIIHSIHGPSFGPFQGPAANLIFTGAERVAGRVTDHFVVVAEAMARQYLAAGIGQPEHYTRIFSGFELTPFLGAQRDPELARSLGLKAGDFVIGKIARLFELKGHEDVFALAPELVRRVPQAKFLFVGDGPWRPRFEQMAREAGWADRFIFAGLVPPGEVGRYVGLMDCLVHLSRREGLPRALPQAMAAGKPVVAYDCDGAGEVCREGETGFLIPLGDSATVMTRLTELAAKPELRSQLGATGRAFVRERFSIQRLVDDQHALYLRLTAARNGLARGSNPDSPSRPH